MSYSLPSGFSFWRGFLGLSFLVVLSSCSSTPSKDSPEHLARLANPPAETLQRIELSLRRRVAFIEDKPIQSYLEKIASRLLTPGSAPISVAIISTTTAGYSPTVWHIPGGSLFIDVKLLRDLRFENEIAAAIALAWERSEGSEFRERLLNEGNKGDPDPTRVWAFEELENQRATEAAVDRLYKAGYDPRGLVNYFDRLPKKKEETLDPENEFMKSKARRTISFYAPLLNPIVRTEGFYEMKKRLERL